MRIGDVWAVTAIQLLSDFRDGLIVLIPIAEKSRMPWRKPNAYDDWERIEAALYESIVVSPFENMVEGCPWYPVATYDFHLETYQDKTFIGLAGDPAGAALVCLDTMNRPFDTCVFMRLDAEGRVVGEPLVPFDAAPFVFVARRDGHTAVLSEINVL
jgi:hypothetical protein